LSNYLAATEANSLAKIASVGSPIDRTAPTIGPLEHAGSYSPERNEVEIPLVQLLPPVFDKDAPPAQNYAKLGWVVGHEVVHGFDDGGRQYDASGSRKDWWTSEEKSNFEDRAACFVSEYERFGIDDQHHENGRLTLGENIADNGGVRLAMKAFLEEEMQKGVDANKPVNGITPLQEFFLTHAQQTCSTVRPESETVQLQNNPHTWIASVQTVSSRTYRNSERHSGATPVNP
jgi:endothelin-converting enzyme/putative endopeptidase